VRAGDVVAGRAVKQDDRTLLAKLIAVVPPEPRRVRGLGKVTAIEGSTITVENRRGTFPILVDDETVFRIRDVENPTIGDVQVGDVVAGRVVKQDDTLVARMIGVLPAKP
jgi:hypothetical protein